MVNRRSDVGRIGEFRQDFIALWMLGCFRSLALGFSLFEEVLLVKGACCFLHSFFVGLDFCLYLFHFLRVVKPAFDAVESYCSDTSIHQDVMVLNVGNSALLYASFLPENHCEKQER